MNSQANTLSRRLRLAPWTALLGGLGMAGIALGGVGLAKQTRKSTEPPTMPHGKMGQDLFIAVGRGDMDGLKDLLAKGADPNSTNGLGFRPLYMAAAIHRTDMMQVLIDAGAKLDGESTYGTPLTFASMTANLEGAQLVLNKGARINFERTDGLTPLMFAANAGSPDYVAELLKHKPDVNAKDDGGCSALTFAARQGNTPVVKELLDAGARVNDADVDGQTPLMAAAMNGRADCVGLLLKKGAKVNVRDEKGDTPLMLACSWGDNPGTVKALLGAGANAKASNHGHTAKSLAVSKGFADSAKLLGGTAKMSASRSPKQALNLSVKLLQTSELQFTESATCVSCHQEGLGRIVNAEAKSKGFHVDPKVQKIHAERVNGMVKVLEPLHRGCLKNPELTKQLPLVEINEVTTAYSWLMNGMAAQGVPATDATGVMAMALARQQAPDGSWTFALPRVPMQSSIVTFTALSVKALKTYGPKSYAPEVDDRIAKARQWLVEAKTANSEDRASRLLGLKWSGAPADSRHDAVAAIRKDQHADGGWGQLPGMASDAYATGQALYALKVGGGVSASDAAYKKGVQYLLRTQADDGSWFVNKRAMPANNYFDAGFPYGESQYASFNGTSWATLALLQAVEPTKSKHVAMR